MQRRFVYSAQAAGKNIGDEKVAGLIPDSCTSLSRKRPSFFFFFCQWASPYSNVFYGLFLRWLCEIKPTNRVDLEDVSSVMPGYCSLMCRSILKQETELQSVEFSLHLFRFYINTTLSAVQAYEALQLNPTNKSRRISIFSSSQRAEVHTNTKESTEHLNRNSPNFPSSWTSTTGCIRYLINTSAN